MNMAPPKIKRSCVAHWTTHTALRRRIDLMFSKNWPHIDANIVMRDGLSDSVSKSLKTICDWLKNAG